MWEIKYFDETAGDGKLYTDRVDKDKLEQMFAWDAAGAITIKDWKEITMNIQVMQVGVDLKNGKYPKVAFTGHRPNKLGGYDRMNSTRKTIKSKLHDVCSHMIVNRGTTEFMEGMAQGVDQDAGDVILDIIREMKNEGDGESYVYLHAAIPFPGQESVWSDEAYDYYHDQLVAISELCGDFDDYVHYVHKEKPKSSWEAVKWLDERNHYMVDWCDLLIAVWDGTPGGTKNAIDYAKRVGKPILLLRLTA